MINGVNIVRFINLEINRFVHLMRNYINRYRLKNKDVSIISNNCIAGVIYHDLKLQFRSPTINLFFRNAEDFLKYVSNLKYYNSLELIESEGKCSYPVGKLEDVEIHFLHYHTFSEAKNCWEKRKKRINYENLVVIMTDQDGGGTSSAIEQFGNIPYPKIYLTNKHLRYSWSIYIYGFDGQDCLGNTIEYINLGRRYYEQFDYIDFINKMKKNDV